jgi:outer membrane protein
VKSVRFIFLTLIISFVAMLAGCVSYQPPPSVIHSDNYTAVDANDQKALPPTDKVLTRQEAVTIALENNPDYKSTQLSMVSAYALYYAALSAYSPTFGTKWGATQYQGANDTTAQNTTKYSGGFVANYQAFSGLTTTMNALGTQATAEAAEWAVKDSRRLLVKNVIVTYNTILLNRAIVRIQQANERFQTQNADNSLLKYNAGADSLSDLLNFKVLKNQAKSSAIQATKDYKIQRYVLAALMGLTTADIPVDTKFPEITVTDADEFELGIEFYLDIAIAERPDLKQYKEQLANARYALYGAWGAFSPTLDLALNYGYTSAQQSGRGSANINMAKDSDYNYSFAFNWNLWEGGSRIFTVRSQEALYDVQKQALLSKWIEIVSQVRTEYVSLLADVASRKVLGQAKEMSQQRRDLVQEEYDAGNKDIAVLNQAQKDMVSAQQGYVTATINVANSRAKLYAAVGVEQ